MDELQVNGKLQLDCEEGLHRWCQNDAYFIMIYLTKSVDPAQYKHFRIYTLNLQLDTQTSEAWTNGQHI